MKFKINFENIVCFITIMLLSMLTVATIKYYCETGLIRVMDCLFLFIIPLLGKKTMNAVK